MRFSILTATYNCEGTVADCLASVRGQSFPDVEHIVVDGASTDGTIRVVEAARKSGMVVVSEPDQGMYDALNKGIDLASGEVVGMLNADDVYANDQVLERVAEVFADPEAEACYGDLVYVDPASPGHGERLSSPPEKPEFESERVVRYWRSGEFDRKKFWWGFMPPRPFIPRSSPTF